MIRAGPVELTETLKHTLEEIVDIANSGRFPSRECLEELSEAATDLTDNLTDNLREVSTL